MSAELATDYGWIAWGVLWEDSAQVLEVANEAEARAIVANKGNERCRVVVAEVVWKEAK